MAKRGETGLESWGPRGIVMVEQGKNMAAAGQSVGEVGWGQELVGQAGAEYNNRREGRRGSGKCR